MNNGEIDKAIELINNLRDMLDSTMENKPNTIIQIMVHMGCKGLINRATKWTIINNDLSDEQLELLYSHIKVLEHSKIIPIGLETEAVFMLEGLADYSKYQQSMYGGEFNIKEILYSYSGLTKLNAISYSEIISNLKAAQR